MTEKINSSHKEENKIEALKFALNNQISWQKYAEAKLLLLTTIAGTSLLSLNGIVNDFADMKDDVFFKTTLIIFSFCSFISFAIGLLGITVKMKKYGELENDYPIRIISWRYIIGKKLPDILDDTKKYSTKKHIRDIIIQHYIGSNHISIKYRKFNIGICFFAVGVLALFLFFLYSRIFNSFF